MNDDSDSILDEEERSIFQPFTRESLAAIEARIDEENAKKKELQKKKEEGEVSDNHCPTHLFIYFFAVLCVIVSEFFSFLFQSNSMQFMSGCWQMAFFV